MPATRRGRRPVGRRPRSPDRRHALRLHDDPAARRPLHRDAVDLHPQTRPGRLDPARSFARHARDASRPNSPPAARSTFRTIVQRSEVAHLYDQGCPLPCTIAAIEFDEPPWDRFLDRPVDRFVCPACRKGLIMHLHYGPGSPATERFGE